MTAITTGSPQGLLAAEPRIIESRKLKTPVVLAVFVVVLAVIYLLAPRSGDAQFALAPAGDTDVEPLVFVGMNVAWLSVAIMAAICLLAFVLAFSMRKTPWYATAVYVFCALTGFLAWAGAGSPNRIMIVGLLSGAIAMAIPLVFGALGGVVGERAGVVNIAIEAQLLMAAFTAAVVATTTGSAWAGLIAAMAAGFGVAAILSVFTITYRVNQVIVGVVLNVLITGITTFLFQMWLTPNQLELNNTEPLRFQSMAIPGLSRIPIIGPVLFDQTILAYLMYIAVAAVWFALYRTRWGLRTRAVGEHPQAADTMGVKVAGTRWRAVLIAGAIVGMGGAYFTLVSNGRFNWEMTGGLGFISLAAVIFGNWNPVRAAFAGLLFGFAMNLNLILGVLNSPVPSQFLAMLPYVVTLVAISGLVGKSRAPAADGVAYVKE